MDPFRADHSEVDWLCDKRNESIIQEYSPVVFAAMNSISLLIDKQSRVILSTYNEQTHGELARKLESTIFSGNHDLGDQNLKLDQLLLDKPVETHFDQVTAVKLRLVSEVVLNLSRVELGNMGFDESVLKEVKMLLEYLVQVPRTCMNELTKLIDTCNPLQLLKLIGQNRESIHEAMKHIDYFVGFVHHPDSQNTPAGHFPLATGPAHPYAGCQFEEQLQIFW